MQGGHQLCWEFLQIGDGKSHFLETILQIAVQFCSEQFVSRKPALIPIKRRQQFLDRFPPYFLKGDGKNEQIIHTVFLLSDLQKTLTTALYHQN